jgi:hypothetical protein
MMHLLAKHKYILLEIFALFILSLSPLLWFKPGHIVVGMDSGYPVDYVTYFQQRKSTWLSSQNFGIDMSSEVGIVPYNSLPALIKMSGVPETDVQKVLFVGWFFTLALSMYALAAYLFRKKEQWASRLLATIIYIVNLHLYSFWLQGEQPILASYALLPLIMLFLLRFIQGKSSPLRTAIFLNLVYVPFGSGGIRGVPLIGPVFLGIITLFLFFLIFNFKVEKFKYIRKFAVLSAWSMLFFIFCNAYFLIPFISSFALQFGNQVAIAGGIEGTISWAKFISTHTSLTNLFRLHGDNNWYDKPYLWAWQYLTNPFLIIGSFIFPILAFSSLLFAKKKNEKIIILFFALFALIGLFFSAGAHPPFGDIYIFMMKHVPGFAAFRSGYYKFIPTVYISFAILSGFSVSYFSNSIQPKFRPILGVIVILFVLGYHYPYFTNTNFEFNKPFSTQVKVPDYVKEFAMMENKLPDEYRTLVVPPPADAFNIKAFTWGYWGSYPLFPLITDRGFVVNDPFVYNQNENELITSLYNDVRDKDFQSFLNGARITNIKYVLSISDITSDYSMSLTESPSKYLAILANKEHFKLKWQSGPWSLYEILSAAPQKIDAYNSVVVNRGSATAVASILSTNSFPFIDQKEKDKFPQLPIDGEIKDFSCVSCHILDDIEEPSITAPKIYPTSPLYLIKLNLENDLNKASTDEEKMNAYLGLSIKRLSELDKLNYIPASSKANWDKSADKMSEYWKSIGSIYSEKYIDSTDYAMLRRISRYLILERNVLTNIINIRSYTNKDKVGRPLIASVQQIEKIDKTLHNKLAEWDWEESFVYDIAGAKNKTWLDNDNLPRNELGEPIMPHSYKLGGAMHDNLLPQNGGFSIDVSKDDKVLTLFFNIPNLFNSVKEENKTIDKVVKNCLTSQIDGYSGAKKYLITAKVNEKLRGFLYVKREYDTFKTQDQSFAPITVSPDYDNAVETYTGGTDTFHYIFSGRVNDKSAAVYFCSGKDQNPNDLFKDISVTEIIHPKLYSYTKNENAKKGVPEVKFNKINSTLYKVDITNAMNPFVLSFSERFSPLWEASIENKINKNHFILNGFANGWYVNKKGDYTIYLAFKPQGLLKTGVSISAIAISALVILLVFQYFKYEKNKSK